MTVVASIRRLNTPRQAAGLAMAALLTVTAASPQAVSSGAEPQSQDTAPAVVAAAGEEVRSMTASEVAARVRTKDWSLIEKQTAIPPDAVADIARLMSSPDREVRELATHALNAVGGPAATDALLKALDDADDIVRGNAARFLQERCSADHIPPLVGHLRTHQDEYVREQVALILGRLTPAAIAPLNQQLTLEEFPAVQRAISLALVRLREERQTQLFSARLTAPDVAQRVAALEALPYVGVRGFIPQILPLLEDTRDAKNIAPSAGRYLIRVCDVAIGVLDQVLGRPFPFPIAGTKRYTPEERARAAAVLRTVR